MAKPSRTNTSKQVSAATIRQIAAQIKRMSDAEVYALTFAGDRIVRRLASQDAHKRAETYALSADNYR